MAGAIFERLAARGSEAVLEGTHEVDTPPVDGGPRFGLSFILRPDRGAAAALDALTASALAIAGGSHWATGSAETSHITIRGLEPHRVPIPDDDPAVARYASALDRATRGHGPIRFELGGLLLTTNSVMLRAVPCDDAAERLSRSVERELGPDGWYESQFVRDIWYLSTVHFAGPIERAGELNEWIEARGVLAFGETSAARAELVRWEFDGRRMVPIALATVSLTG